MKKNLLVPLVVVGMLGAGLILGLPCWLGLEAERVFQTFVQKTAMKGQVGVQAGEYRRGWFSSSVEATYTLKTAPVVFVARHEISHGPFPLAAVLRGRLAPAIAAIHTHGVLAGGEEPRPSDAGAVGKPGSIAGFTIVGLGGGSTTHLEVPKTEFASGALGPVTISSFSSDFTLSAHMREARGTVTIPQLSLGRDGIPLTIDGVTLSVDLAEGPSGIELGETHVGATALTAGGPEDKVSVTGIQIATSLRETDGLLKATFDGELQGFNAGEAAFGPGELSLELRNLDAVTLVRSQKMASDLSGGAQAMEPQQAAMMLGPQFLDLLGEFGKKAPELEMTKLEVRTPTGALAGKAKLTLDGRNVDLAANPGLIADAVKGEGEVAVPRSLLEAIVKNQLAGGGGASPPSGLPTEEEPSGLTPRDEAAITHAGLSARVRALAESMYLVPDGSNYKVSLRFAQGELLVNGKPVMREPAYPQGGDEYGLDESEPLPPQGAWGMPAAP